MSHAAVGMWRDFDTPNEQDSDDEKFVLDGDVPAGALVCSRMNQVGEQMDTAVQEIAPQVEEAAKVVNKSTRRAITTAERVGIVLSDAAADYFGTLEKNDKSRMEMKVVPTGQDADAVDDEDKPLRPLLCHALIAMDRGATVAQPIVDTIEARTKLALEPVSKVLTDIAFENKGGVGAGVRSSVTDMTKVLDALMAAVQGPAQQFEQCVAKHIAKQIENKLKLVAEWGDRKMGIKYHV